jgi:hypothetical protein
MKGAAKLVTVVVAGFAVGATGATADDLLSSDWIERINVETKRVEYEGKKALRVTEAPGVQPGAETLAVVPGVTFADGTIEVELAGAPRAGAAEFARGFVGIAFRLQQDPLRYECFYIRPVNGRAEDQLQRNHSTQYVSHPEFPWNRLRQESPGVYESYVDLVPGEWTKVRIVVSGREARLFVHGADQPCLIVNDLKLGASKGAVALWIGPGTEAHFADLRVVP